MHQPWAGAPNRSRAARPPEAARQAAGLAALCVTVQILVSNLSTRALGALLALWETGAGAGASSASGEAAQWLLRLAGSVLPQLAVLLCAGWLRKNRVLRGSQPQLAALTPRRMLRHRARRGLAIPALLFYLGGSRLTNLLAGHIAAETGSRQEIVLPNTPAALAVAWFAICVAAPFLEELCCRGILQGLLRPYGGWFAVAGQAVLFALLHGSLSAVVFALPAGLYFGYLAESGESLYPGMLLHIANNTLAFVFLWLTSAGYAALAASLSVFCVLAFVPAAAVVAVVALYRRSLPPLRPGLSPLLLVRCPFWLALTGLLAVLSLWESLA